MQQDKTQPTTTPTVTDCNQESFQFPELISRSVDVQFDGHHITSDGGGLLLGQLDKSFGFTRRFAGRFRDGRDQRFVEHDLVTMIRQRVHGIALGYEDLNDHDTLRSDPLIATMCGHNDPAGEGRLRKADKGKALAGKSTLNRLELKSRNAGDAKYKKIIADFEGLEEFFMDEYVRRVKTNCRKLVLDLDNTGDPLHGNQEGRFFHGYYDEYCYTPLYIFDGHWPVVAQLRTSNKEHLEETIRLVEQIVAKLRAKCGRGLEITLRGDSGFCRDELMNWCEENDVRYVLGLRRNAVLERILRTSMRASKSRLEFNGSKVERTYRDFRYKARTWKGSKRRVIGKAEYNTKGPNARFVITNLAVEDIGAHELYEEHYCQRGDMENRIKEQMQLFADRTSTEYFLSNQLRLWFSTLAYILIHQLRMQALAGTELAKSTCETIRLKLFKIGAVVRVSFRRVLVSVSSSHPMKELWQKAAQMLPSSQTE